MTRAQVRALRQLSLPEAVAIAAGSGDAAHVAAVGGKYATHRSTLDSLVRLGYVTFIAQGKGGRYFINERGREAAWRA